MAIRWSYVCRFKSVFSNFDVDETDSGQIYAQNYISKLAHRAMFPDCLCMHIKSRE